MKVVIVCWERSPRTPEARGIALRERVAPKLLESGVTRLGLLIADEHAQVRSPNPFPLWGRRPVAVLNLWVEDEEVARAALSLLATEGLDAAACRVDESLYRDYGDNPHAAPRDWPDGVRSPGVTAVTFLYRPPHLDPEAWVERWFSTISPVSEAIQPRTRYVRNVVTDWLDGGYGPAPRYDGIIEEAFPSARHLTDPFLFYGAVDVFTLARHIGQILRAVTGFTRLWTITTVVMSEWFVQTVPRPVEQPVGR
jgi:hypothetical protein